MERDFYNNEFEELIKQKADQFKLYPSDKVWKRIYSSLHTGRKWFIASIALLISGTFFLAGKELLFQGKQNIAIAKKQPNAAIEQTKRDELSNSTHSTTPDFTGFAAGDNTAAKTRPDGKQDANNLVAYDFSDQLEAATLKNDVLSTETITSPVTEKSDFEADPVSKSFNLERQPFGHLLASVSDNTIKTIVPNSVSLFISPESVMKDEIDRLNWIEQNAKYQIPKFAKKGRLQLLEYLSPTASYRTLSGGGDYSVPRTNIQNIPVALSHLGSPNDFVDHKPAMGFEIGAAVVYRLTRNLAIKTGLQLNYSRYTIEAYSSYSPQPATITLNSVYGYSPNAITSYTNVQNFGGKSRETLQNQYFQVATPVGLELKILGNENLQLNVAATVQPTYLLNRNSYLLTTDYSNYVKEPSLFRRWNVDGGIEAFVSYKVSGLRLQLGPQFRYQFLSTYITNYPIKENLKAYGIKIGISKNIW